MKQLSNDFLRTFVTIIDQGSFQKAGELLGRTQPAISLQIKKLEQQLDKKLFVKKGQSYHPNEDGYWLYNEAKKILAINDNIFSQLNSQKLSGRLRIGIPSEFASAVLPNIIGEFSKRYPDVSLDVTSALSKNLLSSQERQQFDLILALKPPEISSSQLNMKVLIEDDLVWVGDPSFTQFTKELTLVVAPNGCIYRSRIISRLKQQTRVWKITYTNSDYYGLVTAMKQGLGISALSRSTVPKQLQIIKENHLPELGTVKIGLIRQRSNHPQACKALANFFEKNIIKSM